MDMPTIDMDREGAAEAAARYRTIKVPNDEERALVAGFTALAAGKQLINLPDVLAAGGEFDNGMPRLAVMTAERAWCYATRQTNGNVLFSGLAQINGRSKHHIFRFPKLFPRRDDLEYKVTSDWWFRLRSQVPIVPPEHRVRGWKTQCCVLWEVEEWAEAPQPPGDPALIRHLTGDLWTVEATWDLTELERTVLGYRA